MRPGGRSRRGPGGRSRRAVLEAEQARSWRPEQAVALEGWIGVASREGPRREHRHRRGRSGALFKFRLARSPTPRRPALPPRPCASPSETPGGELIGWPGAARNAPARTAAPRPALVCSASAEHLELVDGSCANQARELCQRVAGLVMLKPNQAARLEIQDRADRDRLTDRNVWCCRPPYSSRFRLLASFSAGLQIRRSQFARSTAPSEINASPQAPRHRAILARMLER